MIESRWPRFDLGNNDGHHDRLALPPFSTILLKLSESVEFLVSATNGNGSKAVQAGNDDTKLAIKEPPLIIHNT